jgi:hypothetical protein|tara:strand:+ start:1254 stop:1733 length:480 start_codon:yes stop_codon:yes gene_type:complete
MKIPSGSQWSLIVIIILMLIAVVSSMNLEFFASKLLPVLISTVILILAVIALVLEIKAGRRLGAPASGGETEVEGGTGAEAMIFLGMAAWIFGLALSIYLVGFMISIFLFVGAYMKRHGSNWFSVIITAGIFTGVIHVVFDLALKTDLYKGQLPIWLGL